MKITRETPGIEITLTCEEEYERVRGNAMASGDDAVDKECEDSIIADLESGNPWAWCCAHVIVTWYGFKGEDYLGMCSYKSEEDFREPGGYFDDMVQTAIDQINCQYARACGAAVGLEMWKRAHGSPKART